MSALAALRARVKNALEAAGLTAYATVPAMSTPPLAYVGPGDPYLTPDGASYAGRIARVQIVLVASAGVNDTQADELDQMIEDTATALEAIEDEPLGYEVGRPGSLALNGQPYLGVAIDAWTEIPRSEP